MAKPPTFPILYNNLKTIDISTLKKWGYLCPGTHLTGVMNWRNNGNKTGSVSIEVNMKSFSPYLLLEYTADQKDISYQVPLCHVCSNLKKGIIWYFICPKTGQRCRKLHLIDGYFLHRTAIIGAMYEKQTYSKNDRDMFSAYEYLLSDERPSALVHRKHFKTHYQGKLTKRLIKAYQRNQRGLMAANLIKW